MSKPNRAIIVAESDLHGGHSLGLLNPETTLENEQGNKYQIPLTETQQYLWELRERGKQEVIKLAGKSPIVLFQLGDISQGLVYEASNPLYAQVQIAYMNVLPWLQIKNLVAIESDHGTAVHSINHGSMENLLIDKIHDKYPKIDARAVQHGLSDVYGVKVDHAHKGPSAGSREWLRGNVALYYLRDIMMKDILRGKKPPNLVLRGHYHTIVQVFNRIRGPNNQVFKSWLYVLPSLCGPNEFAISVTKSEYEFTNGIVAFEVVDGRIRESFEFIEIMDIRATKELL